MVRIMGSIVQHYFNEIAKLDMIKTVVFVIFIKKM